MKASKILMAFFSLSLLLATACQSSKSDTAGVNGSVGGAAALTYTAGPSNLPMQGYNQQAVNLTGVNRNNVLTLLAIQPSYLGTIDANNSVLMVGEVAVDHNSGAVIQGSSLYLQITDSFVGNTGSDGQQIQAIVLEMTSANGVSVSGGASNGKAALTFQSSTGWIKVSGNYTAASFNGQVSFQRAGGAQTVLGNFTLPTCSFFSCQ